MVPYLVRSLLMFLVCCHLAATAWSQVAPTPEPTPVPTVIVHNVLPTPGATPTPDPKMAFRPIPGVDWTPIKGITWKDVAPQYITIVAGSIAGAIAFIQWNLTYWQREREQVHTKLAAGRQHLQDQYVDIQDRFENTDPAMKASAALRLAEFAETLDPEKVTTTWSGVLKRQPKTSVNNRFFLPVARHLVTALILEDRTPVRNAIRDALKRMTIFAAQDKRGQILLHNLIEVIAEANRRAKNAFIVAMAEWMATHAEHQSELPEETRMTLARPTKIIQDDSLDLVASMVAFCDYQADTLTCLHSLMMDGEKRVNEIVTKPGKYTLARAVYATKRQGQKPEERATSDALLLPRLEVASKQLTDIRDVLSCALSPDILKSPQKAPHSGRSLAPAWVARVAANRSWRRAPGLDLSECFLSGASLQGACLQGANLRGAWMQGADVSEANLQEAVLLAVQFQGADLSRAKLHAANLSLSHLSSADLQGANLTKANLSLANLTGADLQGANLASTSLQRTIFQGAKLVSADLQGADLSLANLAGTNLENARMQRTMLYGIIIQQATGYDAQQTNFRGVDMTGAMVLPESHPNHNPEITTRMQSLIRWLARTYPATHWTLYPNPPQPKKEPETPTRKRRLARARVAERANVPVPTPTAPVIPSSPPPVNPASPEKDSPTVEPPEVHRTYTGGVPPPENDMARSPRIL